MEREGNVFRPKQQNGDELLDVLIGTAEVFTLINSGLSRSYNNEAGNLPMKKQPINSCHLKCQI